MIEVAESSPHEEVHLDRQLSAVVGFLLLGVPLAHSGTVFDPGLLPKLLVLAIGGLCLSLWWIMRGHTSHVSLSPMDLGVLAFVSIVLFQWPRAIDAHHSALTATRTLSLGVVYFVLASRGRGHWDQWSAMLGLAAGVTSAIGICQYLGLGFLSIPSAGLPSGTFAYRNIAATFVVCAFPFCLLRFIRAASLLVEICWTLSWVAASLFLLYSRSRGAWGGALIASVTLLLLVSVRNGSDRKRWRLMFEGWRLSKTALLLVGLLTIYSVSKLEPSRVLISIPQLSHIPQAKKSLDGALGDAFSDAAQIVKQDASAGQGRMGYWLASLEMVRRQPLLGVGLGNWEKFYPLDRPPGGLENRVPRRPHNDYLWVWSELGSIGLLAYLSIFGIAAWLSIRSAQNQSSESFGLVVAACCGVAAAQTHAFFSFPMERVGPTLGVWFCLSMLASLNRRFSPSSQGIRRVVAAPAAILTLCGIAIVSLAILTESLTLRAMAYARAGQPDRAEDYVDAALALPAFDYRLRAHHSRLLLQTGRLEEAYDAATEVVARHPNSVNSLVSLARLALAAGDGAASVATYERASDLRPQRLDIHLGLIHAKRYLGDTAGAARAIASAKRWHPTSSRLQFEMGKTYLAKGDTTQALVSLSETVRVDPLNTEAHALIAGVSVKLGDFARAITAYRERLAVDTSDAATHYALGALLLTQGQDSAAVSHLETSGKLTNNQALKEAVDKLLGR